MTELSPAAQAVWSSYESILEYECVVTKTDMKALTAALRAAADQVAPERYSCYTDDRQFDFGMGARNDAIREDLIAIANELEQLSD